MNIIKKNGRALLVVAPFVIALVIIWVIYDPFHMISDKPPGGNPGFAQLPLWLWVIGIRALGSFMLRDPAAGEAAPPAKSTAHNERQRTFTDEKKRIGRGKVCPEVRQR